MPYIHSVSTTFPKNYYNQQEMLDQLKGAWRKKYFNVERLEDIFKNTQVGGRHLALTLEEYGKAGNFEERNNSWIAIGLDMITAASKELIDNSNIDINTINYLVSSSVTGIAVPSLEARMMNRIAFSNKTRRLPLFGLGCLAGAAGINRVAEILKGNPESAAIFICLELCSLTMQLEDLTIPNIISSGLFGDGAAAVLMVGDNHPLAKDSKLRWLDGDSHFFPETERIMGWDIVNSGFKIVLNKDVPKITQDNIPSITANFLKKNGTTQDEIDFYIAHPGGPKVLEALEDALNLKDGELSLSWKGLAEDGNMSSVSILSILKKTINKDLQRNKRGLFLAMGPAFCAEIGMVEVL